MGATATLTSSSGNGDATLMLDSSKRFDREYLQDAPQALEVSSLGEGLKLTNRRTVELDHEFAQQVLEMEEFSADRPLDNNHVLRLKLAMERGTFLPEQVTIVSCTLATTGKEYRMNGQHTSWARLEMPEKYRCPVQHLRYHAKTDNDMRRLYASIDRMKGRATGNVVCSYLFDTPEWEGFSKRTLVKLAEALGFWLWESEHHRNLRDGDDRAFLLSTTHFNLGKKIGAFIEASGGHNAAHVRRRPVIAAMFATFNKAAGPADEFWSSVRDGTGFGNVNDPRLRLRNNLRDAAISTGRGTTDEKRSVSGEEMYRWCILSWNAWRRGDAMKLLKAPMNCDRPKIS